MKGISAFTINSQCHPDPRPNQPLRLDIKPPSQPVHPHPAASPPQQAAGHASAPQPSTPWSSTASPRKARHGTHFPFHFLPDPQLRHRRLNDHRTQESFFRTISDAYIALLSQGNKADTLTPALVKVLAATRVLREALLATRRVDAFAQRALLFSARCALLPGQWEGYVPSVSGLMRVHARGTRLSPPELREVVGWQVLDAACRTGEVRRALELRAVWRGRGVKLDEKIEGVLRAVCRDDWLGFWRLETMVDGYVRALMGLAAKRMRVHVLKVVGRAYLRIDVETLEAWTGAKWEELVKEGVGWERDGDSAVVRKAKTKT